MGFEALIAREPPNPEVTGLGGFEYLSAKEPEEFKEGFLKSSARYAAQVPKGIAQATTYGITTGLISTIAQGESLAELDDLEERLPELKKKFPQIQFPEKIDREKYMEALQQASSTFPTVSNIASGIEEKTRVPLEAKTRGQKFLEFASSAGKLAPKDYTFRGMNTSLPKPVLGTGVAATKEALQYAGVPEPAAELLSFAVLKKPTEGAGKISLGSKEKPSGMKERYFEDLTTEREVSASKLNKINKEVGTEFKQLSDKIVKESPLGEVSTKLANDATYKMQSRELLQEAQTIADTIAEPMGVDLLKSELKAQAKKQVKGFAPSEYDKNYAKFLEERLKEFPKGQIKAGQSVEQYRKNNAALSEYFEPGSSKALNRAKRDLLLDENRAIASAMEKQYPKSELVPVFKEGNERWTKIMDAETIEEFVNDIFKEGIDFKQAQELFDDRNINRVFNRALGDEGYAKFEQLTKDMIASQKGYKNLKKAEGLGMDELVKSAGYYFINPKVGAARTGLKVAKSAYQGILNAALQRPKFVFTWEKANNALKAGDFKTAEKLYKALDSEVEVLNRPTAKSSKPAETMIDAKVTPVSEKAPEQARIEYKEKPKAQPKPKVERSELEKEKKALKEQRREIRDKWVEETDESKIAELDTKLEKMDRELFEVEKKIRKEPKKLTPKESKDLAVKTIDQYGLTSFIEEAIDVGLVNKLEDLEPYLRKQSSFTEKIKRIEEDLGKPFGEVIKDVVPKERFKSVESPSKKLDAPKKSERWTEKEIEEAEYKYNPHTGQHEFSKKTKPKKL